MNDQSIGHCPQEPQEQGTWNQAKVNAVHEGKKEKRGVYLRRCLVGRQCSTRMK